MNKGVLLALSAYVLWGLLPLYWKLLAQFDSLEVLAHRIIWSFAFFAAYFAFRKRFQWISPVVKSWRQVGTLCVISILITANWGIYIWAVNNDHIVETSLGYFMNPLLSVIIGVVLLGERLRTWQWFSASLAAFGVLYLTIYYGKFPWIAVSLALTFALYGLLKKKSLLGPMQGMLLETAIVALPATGFLLWLQRNDRLEFVDHGIPTVALLIASGFLTALPLLLFASAAKQIPLSTLGLLQYTAPTLQLLIGIFVFGEAFDLQRLVGFSFIWVALVVFTAEQLAHRKRLQTKLATVDSA